VIRPAGKKTEPLALMACKAVMRAHLSGAAVAVFAVLLDHVNWQTFRCDPGLERICTLTDYSRSSVQAGTDQLVAHAFIRVALHGGSGGRNSYVFNWALIRELDEKKQAALHSRPSRPEMSGLPRPEVQTQTRVENPISKPEGAGAGIDRLSDPTVSKGQARRNASRDWRPAIQHPVGREAAREAALWRWDADLRNHNPELYQYVLGVISEEVISEITAAEMQRRGDGLRYILDHLQDLRRGTKHD
jgi:hypothetical protein